MTNEPVLAVTEQALRADPRAFHGKLVRVAGDWHSGLELSQFADAWLSTSLPRDGRYRVEATGRWSCKPGEGYGHFGMSSAELAATRAIILDAYDRERESYRIPFGKSRFVHAGRRVVIERKGRDDLYRVRVDGEAIPMRYGRIRRAEDGSFTPMMLPGDAEWIALGPALRADAMFKTDGLHRLAKSGYEEAASVVALWRDSAAKSTQRIELRFTDRYARVEVRWFEFPDVGEKKLDPYNPPEKVVRRIRRAILLRALGAADEALADESDVVRMWPKIKPEHRAAIDWPPNVKQVLVDLALEGAADLPLLVEDA